MLTTEQAQSAAARGIAYTPALAGGVLKLVFVAAAAVGTWWLFHSGANTPSEGRDPLALETEPLAGNFALWEPES